MRGFIVAARWQEDVSWLEARPEGWGARVVQKDGDLPNFGREASSYLWFMGTQPIDPDTTYAFLQGDPWPHAFRWAQLAEADRYTPLGAYVLTEREDGAPNHPGLPLVSCLRDWLGSTETPERFVTVSGAQFLIPGAAILSRPREWYADLAGVVSRHQTGPWVMERLWPYVWAGWPRAAP